MPLTWRRAGHWGSSLSIGTVLILILYIFVVPTSLSPTVKATGGEVDYLGNNATGSCPSVCENLASTTGNADTNTSQHLGTLAGNYAVVPDTPTVGGSEGGTGTPSVRTPSGSAWETSLPIRGSIVSGTWTLDLTTKNNHAGGTASLWATVWNCQTADLGTCTLLFKNWDNSTNVLTTTSKVKNSYTTGTIGPFPNVQFLALEWWVHYSAPGTSLGTTLVETTVSADSDLIVPNIQFSATNTPTLTLSATMNEALGGISRVSLLLAPAINIAVAAANVANFGLVSAINQAISSNHSAATTLVSSLGQNLAGVLKTSVTLAASLTSYLASLLALAESLLSATGVSPALNVESALSESASLSLAPSLRANTQGSAGEVSTVVVTNGRASSNNTAVTGVSVAIVGIVAPNGTQIVISTQKLSSPNAGVSAVNLAGASYFDVSVGGSNSTGTATVCVQYSSANPGTNMKYYDGAWYNASGVAVSGNKVCGNISTSALKGTNIAVGNPASAINAPPSRGGGGDFAIIGVASALGLLAGVVLLKRALRTAR